VGLNAIREDFILLIDYEDGSHMSNLDQLSQSWGSFLLDADARAIYEATPKDEQPAYILTHTKERFRQVWHFPVSVCRELQQGENRLSAHDAYWLGLINEIPGTVHLSIREMVEQRDEVNASPSPAPRPAKKRAGAKSKGSAKKTAPLS
jgi:hypothetical protein